MKKLVNLILSMAIILSCASSVFAAEDSGVTEALKKVKERIDTTEYDEFKSSYHKDEDGNVSYNFEWSKNNDFSELYVTFSNGIITNYDKYDYGRDGTAGALSISEADALEIAEAFVKRINPDICNNIKITPENSYSIHSDYYNMRIYRTENGIPVLDESGYISISKTSREVTDFYINYTFGLQFKPIDSVIGIDAAKAAYKKLLTPVLRYNYSRDYRKAEMKAYIEYASKDGAFAINAYDGSVYELFYGGDRLYSESMMAKSEDARGYGGDFTPAELEEAERIAGLLDEEQIVNIIRENEIIAMPEGFKQEYISLNRDYYDKNEYQYEVNFDNGKDGYIGASVDAKNGEILSFYKYMSDDDETNYNRDTEKQRAEAAFAALAGEKSKEFRLKENDGEGYVSYVRTFDGLDVIYDAAYFGFDSRDNVTSYSLSYAKNVEFPSKDGVIAADEAAEKAFNAVGFELAYSFNYDNKNAQPVYILGKNGEMLGFTMNPFTGNLTDYNGEDLKEAEKITYSDIDGHYGQAIFNALAEYGIGISGGELRPDEPITQKDYFVLLNKAFGYDADTDTIYRRLISNGTVSQEERADDSPLTREKAAIFLIREMGAEEYAKFGEIFLSPFDDVTENKGYIAILKAKGIMNGDGSGNFYPQKTVTRGEALIIIYNYFNNN